MLNEGWDVLNLYDIVRLYEERDSKGNKIGKATIQEAQLIGRGVRYFPFIFNEAQEIVFNKRKYDDDIENEYRICETLLFHSKTDSKYLYELKEALKQQGMDIDDKVPFTYTLKDNFKTTELYRHGVIYVNKQEIVENKTEKVPDNFKFIFERNYTKDDAQISLVDDTKIDNEKNKSYATEITIGEYAKQNYKVVYKAFRNSFLSFDILKKYLPDINSVKEFFDNEKYINEYKIKIISETEEPSVEEYYSALNEFFKKLKQKFEGWKESTKGSKEFDRIFIKDCIKDTKREKVHPDTYGEGRSQNDPSMLEKYKMDLSQYDWFVYNDNYGTTEEKSFVKFFSTIVEKIKEQYDEVYLIRNERNMHIYSFDEGGRFEPDYILILKNKKDGINAYEQKQIFIEPKGDAYIYSDLWKENFMLQLNEKSIINISKSEKNNDYAICGTKFYNENSGTDEFEKSLNKAVENSKYQEKNIENDYLEKDYLEKEEEYQKVAEDEETYNND